MTMRLRSYCGYCGARLGPLIDNHQDCAACGEAYFHDAKPCAAVIVTRPDGAILLGRRAIEPQCDLWDLPGGFCHPNETPADCAVRELREETGCDIQIDAFLGHVIDTYGDGGDYTLNAIFVAHIERGHPVAADDVAELVWFPSDGLPTRSQLAFENTATALALYRER